MEVRRNTPSRAAISWNDCAQNLSRSNISKEQETCCRCMTPVDQGTFKLNELLRKYDVACLTVSCPDDGSTETVEGSDHQLISHYRSEAQDIQS